MSNFGPRDYRCDEESRQKATERATQLFNENFAELYHDEGDRRAALRNFCSGYIMACQDENSAVFRDK